MKWLPKLNVCLLLLGMIGFSLVHGKGDRVDISLLTCDSGDELYSTFGHTAIHVRSADGSRDMVYDFGTFDFSTPNLIVKFLFGKLRYSLSIREYDSFIDNYEGEGRRVTEDFFELTPEEKMSLITNLNEIYQSEARYYNYDFFKDNCSTRIRDLLFDLVSFRSIRKGKYTETTIRNELAVYIEEKPWLRLGINILMGSKTDEILSEKEVLFLPYQLSDGLANYNVLHEADVVPFLERRETPLSIIEYPNEAVVGPIFWLSLIGGFLLSIGFIFPISRRWFFAALLMSLGLLGVVLVVLWGMSEHDAFSQNWNLIWANPIYLLVLLTPNRWRQHAVKIVVGVNICFLVVWKFIPQDLPEPIIPLIATLIVLGILMTVFQGKRSDQEN